MRRDGDSINGAAIAGIDVSAVLVDVTPYTFGTSALGELNGEMYPYTYVPIIAKNTAIPVRKSEVFFTVVDDQTTVEVRIFQVRRMTRWRTSSSASSASRD